MKEKDNNNIWTIELTEEQLSMVSSVIEFVSRFACGQIGHTYLPNEISETFYVKKENGEIDWDEANRRRDLYDALGNIIKTTLYPELSPNSGISYGINKSEYADNLYDIYKMINHNLHIDKNLNTSPEERLTNVNSFFSKFGNLPNIFVSKKEIDGESI